MASRWRDDAGKRDPAMVASVAHTWLCGGVGMRERRGLRCSLRSAPVASPCFRDNHTTHIVRLVGQESPTFILFVPTTPRAGPFGPEFMSDNVALCAIPPLLCHADCCPDSPSGTRLPPRGHHRASLRASLMPTPPRRWLRHWAGAEIKARTKPESEHWRNNVHSGWASEP
jgi:hypothetical protein